MRKSSFADTRATRFCAGKFFPRTCTRGGEFWREPRCLAMCTSLRFIAETSGTFITSKQKGVLWNHEISNSCHLSAQEEKKDPAQTPQSCPGVYLCSRLHRNVIAERVRHSAFFCGTKTEREKQMGIHVRKIGPVKKGKEVKRSIAKNFHQGVRATYRKGLYSAYA